MGRSLDFSDYSKGGESAGNDAAASFQRTGYQGCRISPPDPATSFMALVLAARRSMRRVPEQGFGQMLKGQ
jgi:hypothetical protein